MFLLYDGLERHLYAGEHGELPGQAQHHSQHEAGFDHAANHGVGIQGYCAAHLVHIRV